MEPILFIHGLAGYNEQYQPIMEYLKKKGIKKFYEFNYDNKFGLAPIKIVAKELSDFITKNIKEKDINIIAMSQGGIIALACLKYYNPDKNIKKLITLCTPHRGSLLAKIMNLPGTIDLRPKSELLKELEIFSKEDKINIYSIYTPFDLMVFPGWNARVKHGKNKIIFAPTHPAAFNWPTTMQIIYNNLLK